MLEYIAGTSTRRSFTEIKFVFKETLLQHMHMHFGVVSLEDGLPGNIPLPVKATKANAKTSTSQLLLLRTSRRNNTDKKIKVSYLQVSCAPKDIVVVRIRYSLS